ncbi:MAG: nuclear transport factor 2 family protein [Chloroflexota bacterium]
MTMATEQEILDVEHEYWDSMISKDSAVATRLTAERSIITGAQGVSEVTSAGIGEMVQSDAWTLKRYAFSEVRMLTPTPDTAILAYHVTEELEVDGKPLTLEANDSTVWMRSGDGWISVLHTESVAGDPFGREQ